MVSRRVSPHVPDIPDETAMLNMMLSAQAYLHAPHGVHSAISQSRVTSPAMYTGFWEKTEFCLLYTSPSPRDS